MSEYQDRLATVLYHELKRIYPWLAIPDERTPEERREQAEQDKIDLFGPEETKEDNTLCLS